MEYVTEEANKRISYGGKGNNVSAQRITLAIATDVWNRAGLAKSMYRKAKIYYYLTKETIHYPILMYIGASQNRRVSFHLYNKYQCNFFSRNIFEKLFIYIAHLDAIKSEYKFLLIIR